MAEDKKTFQIVLEQEDAYTFKIHYDMEHLEPYIIDEPEPLGKGKGPNAARFLASAVGHCLSASLLFCLQKSRVSTGRVRTEVHVDLARNERGRWRIHHIDVRIHLSGVAQDEKNKLERCLGVFEDYCIVTQSVRQGIPVDVKVGFDG